MKTIGLACAWVGALAVVAAVQVAAAPVTAPLKVPAFDEMHAAGVTRNPPDVTFKAVFKDGKNKFRPGEIILIEMQFSTTSPQKYLLDGGLYDRGGRMSEERYVVDPQGGTVDPLADYFDGGGVIMGGRRSMPILEENPYSIVQELNEWVRFDRPGKYRLFVSSRRLSSDPPPQEKSERAVYYTVTSAILDLEILPPDPAWADEQLRKAVENFDKGGNDRGAAARTMRFLGTEAAAREMLKRFYAPGMAGDYTGEFDFGLIGSPHRAMIVREMEAMLDKADQPISQSFMHTLTLLAFKLRNPDLRAHDSGDTKYDAARWKAYDSAMQKVRDEYAVRLGKALDKKTDAAKAVSLDTLRGQLESSSTAGNPELAKLAPVVRIDLAKSFLNLPPGELSNLLEYRWTELDGKTLLPVLLKAFASLPPATRYKNQAEPREVMLRRINDLSPEDGRRLILAELRRPVRELNPFDLRTLTLLPDKTLPELDKKWAAVLTTATDVDSVADTEVAARLLVRYGTAAVLPQVKAFYGDGSVRLPSRARAALLAYLLRVDEPLGAVRLREALSRGGPADSEYNKTSLDEVSQLYVCPAMEKVAMDLLNGADPQLAANAAYFLKEHGTPPAKPALLARLERFHNEWKGREDELKVHIIHSRTNWAQRNLEQSLVSALCEADAWVLAPEEAGRVAELCVTENWRQGPQRVIEQRGQKVGVTVWHTGSGRFSGYVGRYSIKSIEGLMRKISQFPKGTVFEISRSPPELPDWDKFVAELRTFAESQGMKLEEHKPDSGAAKSGG